MKLLVLKENKKIIFIFVIFLFFVIRKCEIFSINESSDLVVDDSYAEVENTIDENKSKEVENTVTSIFIDVKGAVVNPGVYEMEEGDRTIDVVEKAGGMTHENSKCVNLSHKLIDEEVIYIPSKEEMCEIQPSITQDDVNKSVSDSKININTASVDELETLSGIGSTRAEAIIEYRDTNGNFSSIEDIQNVSGIGESTYSNIENEITT